MIDSHTHLYDSQYDADREAVIERARDAGIRFMISVGCDLETSRKALDLAESHPMIFASVGIHPHEVKDAGMGDYKELQKLAANPRVKGIGESGLDFYYMHSPRESQMTHFRKHIRLAKDLDLPLVIHSRDAKEDTLLILKENLPYPAGGVLHCFTGDQDMASSALDMGLDISFSGIVTFKNSGDLRKIASNTPLDRIHIETDCPYLAPVPFRGKRNEPSFVRFVAGEIAPLHPSLSSKEIEAKLSENTSRLFKIPLGSQS
ncbi:MAG TPA: TatD family hydrolase [Nitrospiria bacterium]|nr:TatD family hydrolase [Nitrospiria bacterium]